MSDGQKINEHIYSHTLFGDNCRFSSFKALDEFFESVPEEVQNKWPYNFEENGYACDYEVAEIISEQLGYDRSLELVVNVHNETDGFILHRNIRFDDDRMVVSLKSIYQNKGEKGHNFSAISLARQQEFLTAYDNSRKPRQKADYSELLIQAASYHSKEGVRTIGGYVWANCGFDFRDKEELEATRRAFRDFTESYGVCIEKKDLKIFTKPCHFAAFGCGIPVKNAEGREVHLGKAFMLQHSWYGRWSTAVPRAEEKRYAEAYAHCRVPGQRRRQAVEQLSSAYKEMLKKYYNTYGEKRKSHTLSAYTRLAGMKLSKLMHAVHR